MVAFDQLLAGLHEALSLINLIAIVAGIALGIVIGVIPGLGSVTAIAVLVPMTYYMPPVAAIAFLVSVNKGGTSGGAVPAILLNTPGTPEAAATAFDGYPLAKKGLAEKAMKFALYSSVTGDTISDLLLILLAVPFAMIALQFGPLEFAAVLVFSFALLSGLSGSSPLKGMIAIAIGVFLRTIGLDPIYSSPRMTFDNVNLYDGLPLASIAIGALALASVLEQLADLWRKGASSDAGTPGFASMKLLGDRAVNRLPLREFAGYWRTILRAALIGSGVGMLPGLGVTLAAFLSYGAARRASPHPESFGQGNPQGIIATEAANSAVVGANLIPTISLGIPGNIAAALLVGAFMIHGVVPGPFMMSAHGDLIYALFGCMLIANFVHLAVGKLGIRLWVPIARAPLSLSLPPVVILCIVGVYLPGQSMFDVGVMLAFAGVGFLMHRTGFSVVCLVIGFLLGGMFETALRQSLLLYKSDPMEIAQSPIAVLFLALTVYILVRAARRAA